MTHQAAKSTMQSAINAKWSHVRLSEQARSKLRTAVRQHPSAAEYLRSSPNVSLLTKAALLDLASQLGIDHTTVQVAPAKPYPEIGSVLTPAKKQLSVVEHLGSALKWLGNLVTT